MALSGIIQYLRICCKYAVLSILLLHSFFTNSQTISEIVFGTNASDRIRASLVYEDGSVYYAGLSQNGSLGDAQIALHKSDPSGNIIWSKFFGTDLNEYAFALSITHDGNLALCGESETLGSGLDIFLMKTDTGGNLIWQKFYGGPANQSALAMKSTSDKGFFIGGFINDPHGYNDMYGLKLDSAGNFMWDVIAGGNNNDYGNSVAETPDGGFLLCGDTRSYGQGGYDIYFVKLDSLGNNEWDYTYGDSLENGCQGTIILNDGCFLTYGETEISPASAFDYFFEKISPSGNSLWRKVFGGAGAEAAFSVIEEGNGDFTATGYKGLPGNPLNLVVFRTDSLANIKWEQSFGGSSIDIGYSLVYHPGRSAYFASGMSSGLNEENFIVIIPDSLITFTKEQFLLSPPHVFPNPLAAGGDLYIQTQIAMSGGVIFNLHGQVVYSFTTKGKQHTLPAAVFPQTGFYLLYLQISSKWVICKVLVID